jgi:hypothetical protein
LRRSHFHPAGQIALLAIFLIPATKFLDRLPAYMRGFLDIDLSLQAVALMTALEEGFEMLLPLLFLQAVFLLPKTRHVRQTMGTNLHRVV